MRELIILLLLPAQLAFSRQVISLDSCYALARENYPGIQQAGIWEEISALKKENLMTGYFPQIILNLRGTYQSDVTGIDIPLPNISIPSVSKDQYKAYVEFTQNIWDGGMTAANARLEDAVMQSNLSRLEVELFSLNEQVSQAFFTILAIKKQAEVLQAQKKVLEERLKSAESAIFSGMSEKSGALELRAEILSLEQNERQLSGIEKAAVKMLSILTGMHIDGNDSLIFRETEITTGQNISRPEMQLYSSQVQQLESQIELLNKSRNPKIFGFGQAGFGRPGLNMLDDEFSPYYLVGMGMMWHIFDWKKSIRQKNVIQMEQEIIDKQEETFTQRIQILLVQQLEQISKLEDVLNTDRELVKLRSEITAQSASKFENGTLTAAGFIRDLQTETVAKLNLELHQIQLNEAKEKYNQILGKTSNN